jgi:FkbM family methyltransferase
MHSIFNTTKDLMKLFEDSTGVFYTLDSMGKIVLRNLKKENQGFTHERFYNGEFDSYNYLYYENFECFHNEAQGSDYFRYGCKINEGMKVLDLGANIGAFARCAIERGASKVYCFEPIRTTYNCLMLNSLLYDDNRIETYNVGISNQTGSESFSLHTDWTHNGGGKMDSLNINNEKAFFSENCAMINAHSLFLDKVWGDVDFLKIDIEGAEYIVLNQMPDKILERLKCIAGEFHCHNEFFDAFQNNFISRCHKFGFQSFVLYQGDGTLRTIHLWKD